MGEVQRTFRGRHPTVSCLRASCRMRNARETAPRSRLVKAEWPRHKHLVKLFNSSFNDGGNFFPPRESIRKQSHARQIVEFFHPSQSVGPFRCRNNPRPIEVGRTAACVHFGSRIHLRETPVFAMSDPARRHRIQNDGAAAARHFDAQRLAKRRARVWNDVVRKIFERGSFAHANHRFEDGGLFRRFDKFALPKAWSGKRVFQLPARLP